MPPKRRRAGAQNDRSALQRLTRKLWQAKRDVQRLRAENEQLKRTSTRPDDATVDAQLQKEKYFEELLNDLRQRIERKLQRVGYGPSDVERFFCSDESPRNSEAPPSKADARARRLLIAIQKLDLLSAELFDTTRLGPDPWDVARHAIAALDFGTWSDVEVADNWRRGQQKGGMAPKRLPGIWQRVCGLVKDDPNITTAQAWRKFPSATRETDESVADTDESVYRDRNDLVEVDDRTGKPRSITYDSFRGYLKAARKKRKKTSCKAEQ
jgi:hypothetical protein